MESSWPRACETAQKVQLKARGWSVHRCSRLSSAPPRVLTPPTATEWAYRNPSSLFKAIRIVGWQEWDLEVWNKNCYIFESSVNYISFCKYRRDDVQVCMLAQHEGVVKHQMFVSIGGRERWPRRGDDPQRRCWDVERGVGAGSNCCGERDFSLVVSHRRIHARTVQYSEHVNISSWTTLVHSCYHYSRVL